MLGALGLSAAGASVSRTATVSLFIPPLSILRLPELGLSGREVIVELRPEEFAQGSLLIPLEIKSNVAWALTAQVLAEDGAVLQVQVVGGPEVTVGTEEVTLLAGRQGQHELLLRLKLGSSPWFTGAKLVLKIMGVNPR